MDRDAPLRLKLSLMFWRTLNALLLSAGCCCAQHARVTLAWDPSPDITVIGYHLHYGGASRTYTNLADTGTNCQWTVSNLVNQATYYFAVTAYDFAGLESSYSAELSYTTPKPTVYLLLSAQVITSTNLVNWSPLTNPLPAMLTNPASPSYYRARLYLSGTNLPASVIPLDSTTLQFTNP